MTPETAPKPACYPVSGSKPEPAPSGNGVLVTPSLLRALRSRDERIHSALADLVDARDAFGRSKYGTGLRAFNGRDPIEDARQELGDLIQYLWQASMEGRDIHEFLDLWKRAFSVIQPRDERAQRLDRWLMDYVSEVRENTPESRAFAKELYAMIQRDMLPGDGRMETVDRLKAIMEDK